MLLERKPPESPRNFVLRRLLVPSFSFLLLSLLLLYYFAFSPSCPSCVFLSPEPPANPPTSHIGPPTNASHLFFALGGSANTWPRRCNYTGLWWSPGETRGSVWLDQALPPGAASGAAPYRISSSGAARFGARANASRIARIVKDAYEAAVAEAGGEVRWLVMGDDDTVFFVENVVGVLGRYDHREVYYIGGSSESVEQDVMHSYGMAFGGGGFAVSWPAAREISRVMDGCLERYRAMWGSDERVHACMSEIGVPLTRELGFHQVDVRGSLYGLLSAHPVAPVVSLHHLDYVDPIFPGSATQLEALGKLVGASRIDPARTLQQSICYERKLNWSVSVAWGYSAEIYPQVIAPRELEVPFRTFRTWRSWQEGPFTFNTRPVGPKECERPVQFFLDRVHMDAGGHGSLSEYKKLHKHVVVGDGGEGCKNSKYVAAAKVEMVRVIASRMDHRDWKRAPRRQCCEAKRSWWGNKMEIQIRKCRPGESLAPP